VLLLTNTPVLSDMPAITLSAGRALVIYADKARKVRFSSMDAEVKRSGIMCPDCGTGMICPKCDDDEIAETAAASRAGRKVITLSSVPRNSKGVLDFDTLTLSNSDYVSGEVLRELLVDVLIGEELRKGKLTPAMLPAMRTLALSNRDHFRQIVASLPVSVDFSEHGHSGGGEGIGGKDQAQRWADNRAKEISKATDKPYSEAFKIALSENSEVARKLFGK
jgi:hypothetical protein